MRKYKLLFLIAAVLLAATSCKKFLDKAPGVDLTENTVFTSKANLDQFIYTTYKYAVHSLFRYRDQNNFSNTNTIVNGTDVIHPTSDITDEGDASEAGFPSPNDWNAGNITSANIVQKEDYRYYIRWIALRQIKLILNRIDEVPDASAVYKSQVKAEMKVLRAMNYMEMLKRYGGVPIVDTVFASNEQVNVPRSSLQDCINFMLKDLNEAIAEINLPAAFDASLKGRVNKATAFAIKSKILLFAASPQWNTATPFLGMANPADNKLICLGNYDPRRWDSAATAAKAAIDFVESNSYALIDVLGSRKPLIPTMAGAIPPAGNYRNAWEQYNNSEIIFGYQGNAASNLTNLSWSLWSPTCYGSFWSGISVPLNFVKKYEDTLGNIVDWSNGGTDLITKYNSLDPRFRQTINYTTSYFNVANPISLIYNGGKDYKNCLGGNWMRKYIPLNAATGGSVYLNDVLFRINELYLNYAEAANEIGDGANQLIAYSQIKKIRDRSGMPPLPGGLSPAQLRQRIRNEIAIELCFEDHRMWDIRRWGIAEDDGVMRGRFEGLQIAAPVAGKYAWAPYTFETRTFTKNMYLHPFPQPEVQKGNLVQNPGYQ